MKKLCLLLCLACFSMGFSQVNDTILSLEEYLGYVKKFHPILKQAALITTESEAQLLKSRGAFDPKIEVDYDRKKFKNTEYYDKLNAAFKIPTWYGIELKGNYENNEGVFLNPEANTPADGLYSAGVSVSLAKGLWINERMATLQQAKLYTRQAKAAQQQEVNNILYNALSAYFNWLQQYQVQKVHQQYLQNAAIRLNNVKISFRAGEMPAVDTLEASVNLKSRLLDLEKASINYVKSKLEVANYLWISNNVPLELEAAVTPDLSTLAVIDTVLDNAILPNTEETINEHPKMQELQFKKERVTIERRLKINNLLPEVDLQYNFLTTENNNLSSFNSANYKSGLQVSFPLFLRKERAELRLAKLKLQALDFDISATRVNLKNKIEATLQEIASYTTQYQIIVDLVQDYEQLVQSEERKFSLGEGSLFLVNFREVKLIDQQLKKIAIEYQLFTSKLALLNVVNRLE